VIAHVAGVPLEETLLPVVGGVGAALLLARAWVGAHVGRPPGRRPDRPEDPGGSPAGTVRRR
jgi:hypothetical protein